MSRIPGIGSCIILLMCLTFTGRAQPGQTEALPMLSQGNHRFLLIFSPDSQSESLQAQTKMLRQAHAGITDRDMVIVQVIENNVEMMPNSREKIPDAAALRAAYRVQPEKFTLILVGKDGGEKYRALHAQAPAVLFGIIDAMPMRQTEVHRKEQK